MLWRCLSFQQASKISFIVSACFCNIFNGLIIFPRLVPYSWVLVLVTTQLLHSLVLLWTHSCNLCREQNLFDLWSQDILYLEYAVFTSKYLIFMCWVHLPLDFYHIFLTEWHFSLVLCDIILLCLWHHLLIRCLIYDSIELLVFNCIPDKILQHLYLDLTVPIQLLQSGSL